MTYGLVNTVITLTWHRNADAITSNKQTNNITFHSQHLLESQAPQGIPPHALKLESG